MAERLCPRCKKTYSAREDVCPNCDCDLVPVKSSGQETQPPATPIAVATPHPQEQGPSGRPANGKETTVSLGRLCSKTSSFEIAIAPGMVIGRNHGSLVSETDRFITISRDHAAIRLNGSTVTITDLESRNGTWVNGKKLDPQVPQPINEGDSVKLADHEFVYKRSP